jgi:hypothetical protein
MAQQTPPLQKSHGFSLSMLYLGIFVCRQSGDDPYEDLAKSSYKPNMKYKFFIIFLFFLKTH